MERCGLDRLEEMKEYLGQEKEQLLMQRMEEAGRRFGDKGCGCKADLEVIIKGLAMGRAEGSVVIASLRSGYITGMGSFMWPIMQASLLWRKSPTVSAIA